MFAQDFSVVGLPYDEVLVSLEAGARPEELLESALQGARKEAEGLVARVGQAGVPAILPTQVVIRSGPLRHHHGGVLLPLSWSASEGRSLLPRVDADLELVPFGPAQTQLVLRARYESPRRELEPEVGRELLQRLVESTLRAFLECACAHLKRASSGRHPPP